MLGWAYSVTPLYSHVNGSGVWGSGRVFTVTETGTKITLDGYINLVAVTSTLHPWLQESVLARRTLLENGERLERESAH